MAAVSLRVLGPVALCCALLLLAWPLRPGWAEDSQAIELELVLAVDSSVSIDASEFALQMAGLAQAFRDPSVLSAIMGAGNRGIAVTLVQWGVGLQQRVAVDWSQVYDRPSAEAFARAIEASPRHFMGNGTGITRALRFSSRLFEDNGYEGRRRVIDISGDGRNNSGSAPAAMRDRLVAAGIVINALAILDGDLRLGRYFEDNVAGGPASFVVTALTFRDFAEAIKDKLHREILSPVAAMPGGASSRIAFSH